MADIRKYRAAVAFRSASEDQDLLKAAWIAIENQLVEWRELRLSTPLSGNGLVIKEKDGTPSSTIRMTVPEALRVGLQAMADELVK